jgi:hypothetical protein
MLTVLHGEPRTTVATVEEAIRVANASVNDTTGKVVFIAREYIRSFPMRPCSRHNPSSRSDVILSAVHFHVTLLAFWFLAVPQLSDESCIQSIEKPSYPKVARGFDSQGTVTVHFTIGDDGKVRNAVYEGTERITPQGNETLRTEVRSVLDKTQLEARCSGDYSLVYRFILDELRSADPHTTVEFKAPNEFVIKANQDVVTCSVYSIEKPSWRKRLFSRLRRRGPPPTFTTVECY